MILQPGRTVQGIPVDFTFVLTNISDHDVRLPKPLIQCSSVPTGTLWLRVSFKPLHPQDEPQTGHGCVADFLYQPILKRVEEWQVLHPKESLALARPTAELQGYLDAAGTYEFWAEYTPPFIKPEDQTTLHEAGIRFAAAPLSTMHMSFKREP